MNRFERLFCAHEGQDPIEYALMAGFVSFLGLLTFAFLR